MALETIDFVVTWVDGSDPAWLDEKQKYSPVGADVRANRYRDWDQLQYWFRAVEKYAPWVNKIHFVTWGHVPQWLDTSNPKLHIVKHTDFIPEKFLPVFSSNAIEAHLHRIPGLSQQFVYFCDDYYLLQPCKPTDFFRNGRPVDMAQLAPFQPHEGEMYYYHQYNDYSIYRKYITGKTVLRNFFKYFHLQYGKIAFQNLAHIAAHNLFFQPRHVCIPLLKSTMEKIWEAHPEQMEKTANSRFRQITNQSPDLFRGYQFATGNFVPHKFSSIVVPTYDREKAKRCIEEGKHKFFCLSDVSEEASFKEEKNAINESFEKVFPGRCGFER